VRSEEGLRPPRVTSSDFDRGMTNEVEGGRSEMRRYGRLAIVLAVLAGFGMAMMGCATTDDLKAVDQKATAAASKADQALAAAQGAKSAADAAAAKADAAAKKADDAVASCGKAAAQADASAKAAAASAQKAEDMAKKAEAIFMKKMKK
jgi:hypothetical protein